VVIARKARKVCLLCGWGFAINGCSFVDNYTARQYALNLHAQDAMNQETLLNIVRSSQYEPLNFMAVSQLTGGQTEQLNVGLPTVTFGPAKAAAARDYAFSGSVVQNTATSGFTINPLISTTYQQAFLTAVPLSTVAQLVELYSREPVFFALIKSVTMTIIGKQSYVSVLNNDPLDNVPVTIQGKETPCSEIFNPTSDVMSQKNHSVRLFSLGTELYEDPNLDTCSYSKFVYVLEYGLNYGLTADLKSAVSGTQPGGSMSSATSPYGTLTFQGALTIGNPTKPGPVSSSSHPPLVSAAPPASSSSAPPPATPVTHRRRPVCFASSLR